MRSSPSAPAWRTRALLALSLAGLALVTTMAYATQYTDPDLQVWWGAARLYLSGIDPYGPVGDAQLGTGSGFAYPLPALILSLPLAPLPLPLAAAAWALMSLGVALALPTLAEDPPPWAFGLMLAYFPLWASLEEAQWGPLLLLFALLSLRWRRSRPLAAGLVLPLTLAKPQVGLALLLAVMLAAALGGAGRRFWLGLGLGFLIWWGGSLLIAPGWPLAWLEQLRAYDAEDQNSIDALSAPGALALALALGALGLAWRRRDPALALSAALLALTLLLPTRSFYNHVVLLLPIALVAARAPRMAWATVLLSWAALAMPLLGADAPLARAALICLPLGGLLLAAARPDHGRHRVQ